MADFVVLTLVVELYFPESHSLKAKRARVKPIVERLRRRWGVSCSEIGGQDTWQRAELAVAVVSGSSRIATETIDDIERWAWTTPDAEVLRIERFWLDTSGAT